MEAILGIIISAILSENFILVKFYGICRLSVADEASGAEI